MFGSCSAPLLSQGFPRGVLAAPLRPPMPAVANAVVVLAVRDLRTTAVEVDADLVVSRQVEVRPLHRPRGLAPQVVPGVLGHPGPRGGSCPATDGRLCHRTALALSIVDPGGARHRAARAVASKDNIEGEALRYHEIWKNTIRHRRAA